MVSGLGFRMVSCLRAVQGLGYSRQVCMGRSQGLYSPDLALTYAPPTVGNSLPVIPEKLSRPKDAPNSPVVRFRV